MTSRRHAGPPDCHAGPDPASRRPLRPPSSTSSTRAWIPARTVHALLNLELPLLAVAGLTLLFPRGPLPLAGLVVILGLWVARLVAERGKGATTPLDLPCLLLLAMGLQSLYPSTDLPASMPKLYGIVLQVAVFYAVARSVRSLRAWWWTVAALSAAAIGVALVGLVGTSWINKLPGIAALYASLPKLITSVQSSLGSIAGIHPNELGGTLAFLLPVAVGVVLWKGEVRRVKGEREERDGWRSRLQPVRNNNDTSFERAEGHSEGSVPESGGDAIRPDRLKPRPPESGPLLPSLTPSRPLALPPSRPLGLPPSRPLALSLSVLALAVAGTVLVLSASRSSYIGLAVALAGLVALRWRWARFAGGAGVVLGAAGLLVYGLGRVYDWALQVDRMSAAGGTLVSRQEVWNRASYMIQDFPFTGIGLNTFPKVMDALYPSFLAGPDARIPHAHNIYLQTAVDLGLAGLMAFLGIWMIVFWQAVQAYRRAEDPLVRGAIAGLAAGCVAYLVYGLTDAITLGAKPLFLLWIMVGLVVAANRLVESAGVRECGSAGLTESCPLVLSSSRPPSLSPSLPLSLLAEALRTLWWLYWAVAVLFAVLAYVVVGISVSGWVP